MTTLSNRKFARGHSASVLSSTTEVARAVQAPLGSGRCRIASDPAVGGSIYGDDGLPPIRGLVRWSVMVEHRELVKFGIWYDEL